MKQKALLIDIGIAIGIGLLVGRLITAWFRLSSPLAALLVSTLITITLLVIIELSIKRIRASRTEHVVLGALENLYVVTKEDLPKATATLVDAFQDDPLFEALFGQDPRGTGKYAKVVEMMLRQCITYGRVFATSERCEGIMAVVQDRDSYTSTWSLLRSGGIIPFFSIGFRSLARVAGSLAPMDGIRKQIMQDRAFAYINIVGVARVHQGKGYGKKLLNSLITACEEAQLPIYLETETESNVSLYERFGFQTCKTMSLPVIGLPMWVMLREPEQREQDQTLESSSSR